MEAQIPHLMVRLQGKDAVHTDGMDGHWMMESNGARPNLPTNDPKKGFRYNLCIKQHEMAPFLGTAHLHAAEEHLVMLDTLWAKQLGGGGDEIKI